MAEKTKKEFKFDIFQVLRKINSKDYEFIRSLSDEDKKAINPYMILRWMFGTSNPATMIWLNELVNPVIWGVKKDDAGEEHYNIKMFLLAICGTGSKSSDFKWIKTKGEGKYPTALQVIREYYGYSTAHAKDALSILDPTAVVDLAEQLGYQPDDIKKLKKELA
jgi:hypothetical protein